jgi:hypothetical protein
MSLEKFIFVEKFTTSAELQKILSNCYIEIKGKWQLIILNDLNQLPDLLDLVPELELDTLLTSERHGFTIACEGFQDDFDVTESPYFREDIKFLNYIDSFHCFHPFKCAPYVASKTNDFILKGIVEMLSSNPSASLEERESFNRLLEMSIIETDWVHDSCTSWTVRLMTPSIDDARVVKEFFSDYIQTALSETDDFLSLQIWIGSGENAVWYDRICIA